MNNKNTKIRTNTDKILKGLDTGVTAHIISRLERNEQNGSLYYLDIESKSSVLEQFNLS
jgi:hypothetical protein